MNQGETLSMWNTHLVIDEKGELSQDDRRKVAEIADKEFLAQQELSKPSDTYQDMLERQGQTILSILSKCKEIGIITNITFTRPKFYVVSLPINLKAVDAKTKSPVHLAANTAADPKGIPSQLRKVMFLMPIRKGQQLLEHSFYIEDAATFDDYGQAQRVANWLCHYGQMPSYVLIDNPNRPYDKHVHHFPLKVSASFKDSFIKVLRWALFPYNIYRWARDKINESDLEKLPEDFFQS